MAARLLTATAIRAAKTAAGETLLADGDGLYLRVRPRGKDWLFIYSRGGRRRKMGLGHYPDVPLERAREKAGESRGLVADGADPMLARDVADAEQKAAEAASATRFTVRTLFEDWHRKEASKRRDQGAEIRRAFEKDVLPTTGGMHADEIKRRHVMKILDDVKERGVSRYANVLLQYLRQMFRFAVLREVVPADPTFGLVKKNVGGEEHERERYLTENEIRELANKLPKAGLTNAAGAALWIMLSTCCRIGEVRRARWSDIDLEVGTWIIPAEHSKNKREHLVHLSSFAREQFGILRSLTAQGVWLFPNRKGDGHVSTKSLQKQFYDRQRAKPMKGRSQKTETLTLAGGEWRAHDLRRTAATLMGELAIRSDVIERCLNHVGEDKMRKIYQRQELIAERMVAFRLLGERLELLTHSEKSPSQLLSSSAG